MFWQTVSIPMVMVQSICLNICLNILALLFHSSLLFMAQASLTEKLKPRQHYVREIDEKLLKENGAFGKRYTNRKNLKRSSFVFLCGRKKKLKTELSELLRLYCPQ